MSCAVHDQSSVKCHKVSDDEGDEKRRCPCLTPVVDGDRRGQDVQQDKCLVIEPKKSDQGRKRASHDI